MLWLELVTGSVFGSIETASAARGSRNFFVWASIPLFIFLVVYSIANLAERRRASRHTA